MVYNVLCLELINFEMLSSQNVIAMRLTKQFYRTVCPIHAVGFKRPQKGQCGCIAFKCMTTLEFYCPVLKDILC